MTSSQVFRWFCKEQGITHLIHRIYCKIQPHKIQYNDGMLKKWFLSFDEYIDDMINEYGFHYLLERIINAYKSKICLEILFNDYCVYTNQLNSKFKKLNRKWEYFAKNNIHLETLSVGDIVTFKDWGEIRKMKVTNADFYNSKIHGTIVSDNTNWNGRTYTTFLENILDDNEKKIKQSYLIKRNKKVYNGTNSR